MDATTLLLFFFVAFLVLCWRKERSDFVRQIELIPGPPFKLPIIGNLLNFPRNGRDFAQYFLVECVKKYGPVFRIWRGSQPIVVLSSPEAVELIFSSQKHINKSPSLSFLVPWLGYGLLLSNGDKWREDRRLLTPAFHFQILNDFFEVFNRNANTLVEQIAKRLTDANSEIDVAPLVSHCTLDIVCEAAMGVQVNAQVERDTEYVEATAGVTEMIQQRVNSFLGLVPDWIYFNVTPHGRKCQKLLDIVHSFSAKVLKERKDQLLNSSDTDGPKKRKPFLELLLESARQGVNLTDEDILSQVDTFMFEGHDTTATAITWFLYSMATNQHDQEQVYQEIYDCFGDSDRPCTLEDLPKLKYLECCLKETMRLHPSVPLLRRQLLTEEMKVNGYTIPVGATVQMQVYAVHHDEKHFPDPYAFKPERFLPEQSVGRHPYAYVPFSAGPRNCIGLKFATYEDKVILTNLLRKFRFNIDPRRVPVRESISLILKPEGGMPLIITPRH